MYDLVTSLFDINKSYYADAQIERLRERLLEDDRTILTFTDYGAGGQKGDGLQYEKQASPLTLTKKSTSNVYKCRLLRNLSLHSRPKTILELGTNLGLATCYLKAGSPSASVHTIEGAKALYDLAGEHFKELNLSITQYHGLFDAILEDIPSVIEQAELVYIDGDHTYEGTLRYFKKLWNEGPPNQIIVMDDINWSKGMRKAWAEIKAAYDCSSINLYKLGIVIKNEQLDHNQHIKCIPRIFKPLSMGFWG